MLFYTSPSFTKRYAIQRAVLTLLLNIKISYISPIAQDLLLYENKDGILIWKPGGKNIRNR
jgi:hypothetical protein